MNTELSNQQSEQMFKIYRHLHQNPELSMQEYET